MSVKSKEGVKGALVAFGVLEALYPAAVKASQLRACGLRIVGEPPTVAALLEMALTDENAAWISANLFPNGHPEVLAKPAETPQPRKSWASVFGLSASTSQPETNPRMQLQTAGDWTQAEKDEFALVLAKMFGWEPGVLSIPAAAPQPPQEKVVLLGEKADGSRTVLGEVPMPPEMKQLDLARQYFSGSAADEDSDTAYCLYALQEYHTWLLAQGWQQPPLSITPDPGDGAGA